MDPLSAAIIAACGASVLGLCAGSFLNVACHRLPRGLSLVHPPSRCGACGTRLAWHDNLPLLGWMRLRGRCRHCGTAFSARYVLMELLCGLLAGGTVMAVMLLPHLRAVILPGVAGEAIAAGALLLLVFAAVVATVIDLDHQIIPDELTLPLMALGPWLPLACMAGLFVGAQAGGDPAWLATLPAAPPGWLAATAPWLAGAVLAVAAMLPLATAAHARLTGAEAWQPADRRAFTLASLWSLGAILLPALAAAWLLARADADTAKIGLLLAHGVLGYAAGWLLPQLIGLLGVLILRRNAMGFGDAKLFAPLGALLGPDGVVWAFLIATCAGCLLGIPGWLRGGSGVMPFGPSLVIGWAVALVAAPWLPLLPWQR